MRRASIAVSLILSLAGCATTAETLANARPSISYDSALPPALLAECLENSTSTARFLGAMFDPPISSPDGDGLRLHWLQNPNVFAKVTPSVEGSHLDFYFNTLMGAAGRGHIERIVRSCQ